VQGEKYHPFRRLGHIQRFAACPLCGDERHGSIMLNLTSTSHLTLEGIPGGLQNSWFNFNA